MTIAPLLDGSSTRHEAEARGTDAFENEHDLGCSRVLVVAGSRDARERMCALLSAYDVQSSADGAHALLLARARRPDLVVSETQMSGIDGLALIRELRGDPDLSYVPVILLSDRTDEDARIEGLEAGAEAFLVTPYSDRELLACVRVNLRQEHARRRSREALRASEARYRALVTASSDVVYQMSSDWTTMQPLDGRTLVASNATPIVGWMEKNIPVFEHARIRTKIDVAVARKQTFELEHQVIRTDGSLGWTYSRAVPILDEAGTIIEWFGTASDVT